MSANDNDGRIEFDLMHDGRRLGVRFRRFVRGKLAISGFVDEDASPRCGRIEPAGFRACDAAGFAEARLRRMARLALEAVAEASQRGRTSY